MEYEVIFHESTAIRASYNACAHVHKAWENGWLVGWKSSYSVFPMPAPGFHLWTPVNYLLLLAGTSNPMKQDGFPKRFKKHVKEQGLKYKYS